MKKWVIFSCISVCSCSALADTVWLKNGDVISGSVKLVDSNKLLLDTDFAGTVSIDRNKIKTFSVDAPVELQKGLFGDKQRAAQVLPDPDKTGSVILASDNEQTVFALNDDFILMRNKPKTLLSEYLFNGRLNGGAYYNKGTNKTEQYMLDGNLTARHDLLRHNLYGNLRRTSENSQTKTYNYTLGYNLDRFITTSFFWTNNVSYKHDWIEDIKGRLTVGTGPGYQLWDDELGAFSLSALINYQRLEYRDDHTNNNPLGSVKWDYERYFMSKTVRLFTNGSIGRSFDDSVDYELSGVLGLGYNLTSWLSVNATLSRDKSKTKDGDSSNTNYGLGLGVSW
ncbi:DUF481 domain-containing protein [Utexia brackfieldae]|uniref:DUF481 domain-containing protein n=1 Tax=Utexia brackfieldae TaxID=3074108 RepID=UPI00370D4422